MSPVIPQEKAVIGVLHPNQGPPKGVTFPEEIIAAVWSKDLSVYLVVVKDVKLLGNYPFLKKIW